MHLEAIALALRKRSGADFDSFRKATLAAAIEDRAARLSLPVERYIELIEQGHPETDALVEACLVNHTSFFRDADVIDALRGVVLPSLLSSTRAPLRAWVAGVASGEEAWSLAMLLARCGPQPFDVLATDLSLRNIDTASRGQYALGDVGPAWLEFFELREGKAIIGARLRHSVHFAVHDLLGPRLAPEAAVVAHFDLVSCRNVLLWFDERYRRLALERIAAVLRPGGVLVLGHTESLPEGATHFQPCSLVSESLRIFERRP